MELRDLFDVVRDARAIGADDAATATLEQAGDAAVWYPVLDLSVDDRPNQLLLVGNVTLPIVMPKNAAEWAAILGLEPPAAVWNFEATNTQIAAMHPTAESMTAMADAWRAALPSGE